MLKDWKVAWKLWVGREPTALDPVFADSNGKHQRPRIAEQFRADAAVAGLPTQVNGQDLDFYAARRSFSTWLYEAEVDEETRGRLLGHAAKSVTSKHYSATVMRRLCAAVCRIDLVDPSTITPDESAEIPADSMARPRRFELLTLGSVDQCSIQLSYGRSVSRFGRADIAVLEKRVKNNIAGERDTEEERDGGREV